MLQNLKKAYKIFHNAFPFYKYLTYIFLIIIGLLNFTSIFSVIPLITVIVAPDTLLEVKFIQDLEFISKNDINDLKIYFAYTFLILIIISQILIYINSIVFDYISKKVVLDLKKNYFKKILNNKLQVFNSFDITTIFSIADNEISKIGDLVNSSLFIFRDFIILSITMFGLIFLSPKASFVVISLLTIFFFIYLITKKTLFSLSQKNFEISKNLSSIYNFLHLGYKELLVFNLKTKLLKSFDKLTNKFINLSLKQSAIINLPRTFIEIFLYFLVVIYFLKIENSNILVEQIPQYAFLFLIIWKNTPLIFSLYRNFSLINQYSTGFKNLNMIEKGFNKRKFSERNQTKNKIYKFSSSLKVEDVIFKYPNNPKKFKFNFKIEKRDKVLIQGKSGSGKTTLINLISGLLRPDVGKIKLDNLDIESDLNGFFSIMGYVSQTPFIFGETIANNISLKQKLNKTEIDKLRIIYEICGIENIENKFENIFIKIIKTNAPELSGGQKQRISLARVLFSNPQIIIIDEGLNALDVKSEKKIITLIQKYFKNITLIYISHRPQNLTFNRKIFVK